MQITPLGKYLGAECTGFDVRKAAASDIEHFKNQLAEHSVIAFRDQELSPQALKEFGEKFGQLEFSIRERFRLAEQPEVYVISNIVEKGRQLGNPNDGFLWHTDANYMERPTGWTFLYAKEVPPEGGDTQFASTYKGYEDMPEPARTQLSRMTAVHSHDRLQAQRTWDKPLSEAERSRTPDVDHPMVRTHPITGRKGLHFSVRSSFPKGISEEERLPFLHNLVQHCTKPEYVYSHKWRKGDLVVWDNRGLLHRATEYDRQNYRRLMHRVSVVGERPF